MKHLYAVLAVILLIAAALWRLDHLMPSAETDGSITYDGFKLENAQLHIREMSQKPHYVGSTAHKEVEQYLVAQLEELDLNPEIQQGMTSGDWGNLSKATNIMARIKGTGNGRALVLMSHYDSNPHSALGASDAASGVAVILEAYRAYKESGATPENDLILLFTDAEELGLNGAQLFVREHPWAKDVALVLNFEARGSGGPSYTLLETNGGNRKMIEAYSDAHPEFPVANSLAYSIYKMLPNDTDLTVFREDGNIQGFNFAFIDDHFDYHTVNDNAQRLNPETLLHQATYLMPLLKHFAKADLDNLRDESDLVYFDFPLTGLVYYPFSWIIPSVIIASALLIILLIYGIRIKRIRVRDLGRGFLLALISLITCGLLGYFIWPVLKTSYPGYNDILHGFTYNGHLYIYAVMMLSLGFTALIYQKSKPEQLPGLMIAPMILWLLICTGIALTVEGGSFLLLPLYASLAMLWIRLKQEAPHPLLLLMLCLPALWMLLPFMIMFPVGLGLKILISTAILSNFLFGLSLPVLIPFRRLKLLGILALTAGIFFLVQAHLQSSFTKERPHPTSLVYLLDADGEQASWATYNHVLDSWLKPYFSGKDTPDAQENELFSSKYGTGFTHKSAAPLIPLAAPSVEIISDTLHSDLRRVEICITPHRMVNRLEGFANTSEIQELWVNDQQILIDHKSGSKRLFRHFITDNESTRMVISLTPGSPLELSLYEASFDLLQNQKLRVPSRPENTIPMPFVVNDAVIIHKTVKLP